MPTPPNPAPKGRQKTAQDKVHDASPDEVLGNPRKKIQAPQGAQQRQAGSAPHPLSSRAKPRDLALFVMPGNLGAQAMAELLVAAKNDIRACCRDNEPPISASVLRNGGLKLLMDARGNLHDRDEEKLYHKGRVTTRVPYKS